MRKMFLIAVASCTLLAIAPATALAKHSSRHHRGHHARVHHKSFGTDPASPTTPSGTTTPVNTAPATLSVVNFTPNAGDPTTGTLTISDANGQPHTGMVTGDTRLICVEPQQPPNTSPSNTGSSGSWQGHDHGGDNGGSNQAGGGDDQGDQSQGDDQGQGDDEGQNQCSTADLQPGTPVQFADLSMTSSGNQWDTVVLQVAQSTAPTVSDTDNDGN